MPIVVGEISLLAGDATQEAFVSAHRHLDAFRGGSLHSWLMRIVTKACYDQLRKKQRQRADSMDDLLGDQHTALESPRDLVERGS